MESWRIHRSFRTFLGKGEREGKKIRRREKERKGKERKVKKKGNRIGKERKGKERKGKGGRKGRRKVRRKDGERVERSLVGRWLICRLQGRQSPAVSETEAGDAK